MNNRILVTGASGFLGSMIIKKLLSDQNYEVHGVTNSRRISSCISHSVNLLDTAQITKLMQTVKPTHLIHLAWETRPAIYLDSPDNMEWVAAGIHLIRQFKENGGIRLVTSGTCYEYDMTYQMLSEEKTPMGSDSLYGISKRAFYNITEGYCKNNEISYACGRIFFMYGEQDKPNRAVPYAINNFLKNEKVVCNSANAYRDYMHVYDGADAFISLMKSDYEGALNIASGIPTAMGDIFMEIARQMDCKELLQLNNMKSGIKNIVADISRMEKELNFTPGLSLQDGIGRTIQWHRERLSNENS